MKTIKLLQKVGSFAENKDIAKHIRLKNINPILAKNNKIILDFKGVQSTTQSFIHALISELIRENGSEVLDNIYFKNCENNIKEIIKIVVEYMQA